MSTCTALIFRNEEHHGIELKFAEKPSYAIREELKKNGFRWHNAKRVWYAKETPQRLEFARKFHSKPKGIFETLKRIEEIEKHRSERNTAKGVSRTCSYAAA